jgi:hypothetical protein
MIKFLLTLVAIGGISFWLYNNWEILDFDSQPEKLPTSEEQQKLNRQKRNPYFDDENY